MYTDPLHLVLVGEGPDHNTLDHLLQRIVLKTLYISILLCRRSSSDLSTRMPHGLSFPAGLARPGDWL